MIRLKLEAWSQPTFETSHIGALFLHVWGALSDHHRPLMVEPRLCESLVILNGAANMS